MTDIESMLSWSNVVGYGTLVLPALSAGLTVVLARRSRPRRVQRALLGIAATCLIGAAGTIYTGESLMEAIGMSSDVPYYRVAEAWQMIWYPIGIAMMCSALVALWAVDANSVLVSGRHWPYRSLRSQRATGDQEA